MPLNELKIVIVLIILIVGSGMSYFLSQRSDPEWYLWVLAWISLPTLIGAFFLMITIHEKHLRKKEMKKRVERHNRKHQKKT